MLDRTKRVKDAKSEAQKEIEDYRKQKEQEFQSYEKEVSYYAHGMYDMFQVLTHVIAIEWQQEGRG